MHRILLLALLFALLLLPSTAGASTSGVVVSQVYGGGGNSGASFQNDFVELFNAGATAVRGSGCGTSDVSSIVTNASIRRARVCGCLAVCRRCRIP